MRNSQDRHAYRQCKCVKCGNEETIFWSMIVPTGIIIEADVPCDVCGESDAMLGNEIAPATEMPLGFYFNPQDVLVH